MEKVILEQLNEASNQKKLVEALKNGDNDAFKSLFEMYHQKLYFFLFAILKSKEDVEEIIQETFLKVWENRANLWIDYSFEAFVFRIAKNTSLNYHRKRVNRTVFENHLSFFTESSNSAADEYVLFEETKQIIRTILNGLPPKRKEIFLLARVDGLSRKEIAEKLGISVITVDHQLSKSNSYVKEEFEKFSLLMFNILFL